MLTAKQNMLETINWGHPEYVPLTSEYYICGLSICDQLEQPFSPLQKTTDPFGVHWLVNSTGAMHDTTVPPMFTEIEDWRDYVKIPDISHVDFKGAAEAELQHVDRDKQLVVYYSTCGVFERLASFMGFENALISLAADPEECMALFDAITDYKIEVLKHIKEAFDIDVYYNYDDVATARGTFMSPKTYREVIKPSHAKLAKAVTDMGIIFGEHTCGKCEDLLEDYVEFGTRIWHSAQIMNDLPGIQEKFKGRLVIEGGWDSSGKPGMVDASEEVIRAETIRCLDEYGKNGGFILMPLMFNEKGNSLMVGDPRMDAVVDEWKKHRDL